MSMSTCLSRWVFGRRAAAPVWARVEGLALQLRPIQAADAEPLGAMFARMSAHSRRRCFHATVRQVPAAWLAAMSQPDDSERQTRVLCSQAPAGEQLWAEARWCRGSPLGGADSPCAEFALSVVDRLQHHGLGERLLDLLETSAAAQGLNWLCGDIESDNVPMLTLLRHRGYHLAPDLVDPGLVRARCRLGAWA